jgi:putative ATP-binding cassette transporter
MGTRVLPFGAAIPVHPSPERSATRRVAIDRRSWQQLVRAVRSFLGSEVGRRATWLLGALLALMLALNALNVVNSYVGRDFMTAIERRSMPDFVAKAFLYLGVFAASTVAAVILRFSEERLALLWREWLTRVLLGRYLGDGGYYHLRENGEIENPDQRIADDVRAFTGTTVSFFLMLANGTLTIVSFSGVLWSISPLLFSVAVGYALAGSLFTVWLGRPLVWLNYNQSDKEASFRADLVHVRENAESIVYLGTDRRLRARLHRRVSDLVSNFRHMIAVNRNLGFFTTGYNYLIQIIPALIVAPLFMRGQVEFGAIPQSAMAFSHLLGAFSLIVTQFQSISSYAAAGARLAALSEAAEQTGRRGRQPIAIAELPGELVYEGLTLCSPHDGRPLIRDLSLRVSRGEHVWISGPDEAARLALFRATAGIWSDGQGRILRPSADQVMFLAERPYLPPGSLRQILLPQGDDEVAGGERIELVMKELGLGAALARIGDLDFEHDWHHALSLAEQQLFALARIALAAPRFALLQRIGTMLDPDQVARGLRLLSSLDITYLTLGAAHTRRGQYHVFLELAGDGAWNLRPAGELGE